MKVYRTDATPTGYFRRLDSIHVHIDAGQSSEVLTVVEQIMGRLASQGLKSKLNKISRAVAGRQRVLDDYKASYESHTPGQGDDEDFGLFSTIGFGPQREIGTKLFEILRQILDSLNDTVGVVIESERVNGLIEDGVWKGSSVPLIPTVTDKELGWKRLYTSPIEIHHAIDFEKVAFKATDTRIAPERLLSNLENAGILLGGMFLFEKSDSWSLRTSQFANYDDYQEVALAHHFRLLDLLQTSGLTAKVWTISEQILGVWKTGSPKRPDNVLYVPQLAHWERMACGENDRFWVIAADFLGDVDPDVEAAMCDNLSQDVEYTYFVRSYADVQRLRQMMASFENRPTIGSRAKSKLRAVLLRGNEDRHAQHELLKSDYFIANPHDLDRAEGYQLARTTRSGDIAHGSRVPKKTLSELINLLKPLLIAPIHGVLLPNPHERESSIQAVMLTDLQESSKWFSSISAELGEKFLEEYDKLVGREVSRARGRVIKALGDGYLCVFNSATDSAHCAARLQKAYELIQGSTRFGDSTPSQRVALETGDLVEVERSHGNDISGISIAQCARLLDLCTGGHIVMSQRFWDLAKQRLQWVEKDSFHDHGPVILRSFEHHDTRCLELLWITNKGRRCEPMVTLRHHRPR